MLLHTNLFHRKLPVERATQVSIYNAAVRMMTVLVSYPLYLAMLYEPDVDFFAAHFPTS